MCLRGHTRIVSESTKAWRIKFYLITPIKGLTYIIPTSSRGNVVPPREISRLTISRLTILLAAKGLSVLPASFFLFPSTSAISVDTVTFLSTNRDPLAHPPRDWFPSCGGDLWLRSEVVDRKETGFLATHIKVKEFSLASLSLSSTCRPIQPPGWIISAKSAFVTLQRATISATVENKTKNAIKASQGSTMFFPLLLVASSLFFHLSLLSDI